LQIVTLLTDFGLKDGNVGVMKGVIWNIAPRAHIADLSHNISPQNIAEAALILFRAAPFFPDGSVHLVVVDPGVGTERMPIAAQLGSHFFVGPDNGVITLLLEWAEKEGFTTRFYHLDKPNYWLSEVSSVFHGRDIFAPVAANLAMGIPLSKLGTEINTVIRLELPQPVKTKDGWHGEVIHIDHFGNISSNIRREHIGNANIHRVSLCGEEISGSVRTFAERPTGELIALFGSTGNLIVSVVNGSAAGRLGAKVGDEVLVELKR